MFFSVRLKVGKFTVKTGQIQASLDIRCNYAPKKLKPADTESPRST